MPELAVLTGDIVRSQRLADGALEDIFHSLHSNATELGVAIGVPAYVTRMRGDGWQCITEPTFALRMGLVMRAAVRACGKGFETRLAISIGRGTTHGDKLHNAAGPGFVSSGRALDDMKKAKRMVPGVTPGPLRSALPLAEAISARWTQRQAQVVLLALALPTATRETIAGHLGVSQQTLQDHWTASAAAQLIESCAVLEKTAP